MTCYLSGYSRTGSWFVVTVRGHPLPGESRRAARAEFERTIGVLMRTAREHRCTHLRRHRTRPRKRG